MSLVNYEFSSDEDEDIAAEEASKVAASSPAPSVEKKPIEAVVKLPDAALLLESENAPSLLGKREHMPCLLPKSKIPKGNRIPHLQRNPESNSLLLVPPQLSGKSNVVTEDIGKLFVKKKAGSPN